MRPTIISHKKAKTILEHAGIDKKYIGFFVYDNPETGVKPTTNKQVMLIEKLIKSMGKESFLNLARDASDIEGMRTIKTSHFAWRFKVLRAFGPVLSNLFNKFESRGLNVRYSSGAADRPFLSRINLYDPGSKNLVASYNFSLHFDKENKPAVILGNMQGFNRALIDHYKGVLRMPLLNYFLTSFGEVFPKDRRLALNPKFHAYMEPSKVVIANKFRDLGKTTQQAVNDFHDGLTTPAVEKLKRMIEKEEIRIKTAVRGMHTSAFSKFYHKSNEKFWIPK